MATTNYRKEAMQTEQDTTYNGWTNYATWGVKLVLDNDEGTYNAVREMAQEAKDESVSRFQSRPNVAVRILSDRLKDYTEELCGLEGTMIGEDGGGIAEPSLMAKQVLAAGLAEVDWREIAENVLSED